MLDCAIHWINHYPWDSEILISVIFFCWIVIYLVDSAIQYNMNNLGQDRKKNTAKCLCMTNVTGLLIAHSVLIFYKKICLKAGEVLQVKFYRTNSKKICDQHMEPFTLP